MNNNRPISPHITIYKLQLTSMLSLFHRFTGAFMAISICLFVFLLKLTTFNITNYTIYTLTTYLNTISNWLILSFLFSILFSLYYHLYNGIRHLFWDKGSGFEIKEVYSSGYLVVFLTIISTLFTWIAILG